MSNNAEYIPELDDIVIINTPGGLKKRHIYDISDRGETSKDNTVKRKTYFIDYGLGLCSEGICTREQILRKATDDDILIPL